MKNPLKRAIRGLLYALVRITPKTKTAVLRGFPDFDDNLIAIYHGLLSRPVKSIIWVVDDVSARPPIDLDEKVRLVKRGGVLDVYYSVTARFLFITHGHFLQNTPSNQISVNLWHGLTLKAIGKLRGDEGRSDTLMVATSPLTQQLFAKAFGMPESRCVITGQARTDRMFGMGKQALWQRAYPDQPIPKTVYLWLPTYRRSDYLKGQKDGVEHGNVFNCSDFSDDAFNAYLEENNAVCLVKPHPMAPRTTFQSQNNILYIDEDWLSSHRLTLYQLTGAVDCLISDTSSIIVDFLLLDRPLILLFEDIIEYESSRGFALNPITDYLPAKVAQNFESFMEELAAVQSGQDLYAEKRRALKKLFFTYDDAKATDRILDHTFERLLP